MKLFFCEKCGKRVTDQDLASGEALDKQVKGVHCKDCAEGVMTMTFEALTDSQAKALVQKTPAPSPPSASAAPTEALSAPISSSRAMPVRAPMRDSHPRRPVPKPEEANATPWIAAAAVGLAITLVCALVLLKGSAAPAKPVASTGAKTAEESSEPPPSPWDSNAPEAAPDDLHEAPAAPVPPAVPARTPAPAPAAPAKPAPAPADAPPRVEKPKPSPIGPDGLLIHLTFDGEVNDSGPLKLEAKARAAPAFEAGIHGQAYVTKDGSKDNTLVLDRKKALYDLDNFTIACWVRVDKTAPRGSTLILNHMRWSVSVGAKGFGVGVRGVKEGVHHDCAISDGQWHHLAVALDGKVLRCYLDGAALPPRDVPGADVRMEGTWAIAVMGSPWNGCTVGAMDDFRYYNRAISPEDAAQLAKR